MSPRILPLLLPLVCACPAPPGGDGGPLADGGGLRDAGPPCWTATAETWPGDDDVTAVDAPNAALGNNLSGAVWQPDKGALLAVQNGPSLLHQLKGDGAGVWADDATWPARTLLYPNGAGAPDSEGVTIADPATPYVWVATERDNDVSLVSRLSVLRYDTSVAGATLTATHEWDLTTDLASIGVVVAPNAGLEAITFVPDADLTAAGFIGGDGLLYDPAAFGDHAGGLFLVGLEGTGGVYAYALALDGSFARVALVEAGLPVVVSLEYDRTSATLFAGCDDNCANQTSVLALSDGGFQVIAVVPPPPSLGDPQLANNEGIAIGQGDGSVRPFFWTRDGAGDGAAVFTGTVPAGGPCQ